MGQKIFISDQRKIDLTSNYVIFVAKNMFMYRAEQDKCQGCACISTPFRYMTPDELSYINRNRVDVQFRRGESLCKEGIFASSIYYIKEGLIKIFSEDLHGAVVLSVESRGYFLGLQALSSPHKYTYSATAFEDTQVCTLDINAFRKILVTNPLFATAIVRQLSKDTRKSFERIATVGMKQLHGRLADLLLCLSVRIYKSREFTTSLGRKDMAEVTMMSQESLSRVLKSFRDEGILSVHGKNFVIRDINTLRRISKTG
jgi:CRP/FNR family transcriptional regulator